MSVFAMIFGIVLVTFVFAAWYRKTEMEESRLKHGAGLREDERRALEDDRNAARAEIENLRDRVRVLERIATDPSRRTAEEIESLRDER